MRFEPRVVISDESIEGMVDFAQVLLASAA